MSKKTAAVQKAERYVVKSAMWWWRELNYPTNPKTYTDAVMRLASACFQLGKSRGQNDPFKHLLKQVRRNK